MVFERVRERETEAREQICFGLKEKENIKKKRWIREQRRMWRYMHVSVFYNAESAKKTWDSHHLC
jgi:hypothetical protein